MGQLRIKSETLAKRCEICHQSDRFDAIKNFCSRCSGAGDLLELTARARYLQQRLYAMRSTMMAEQPSSWPFSLSFSGDGARAVASVWFAVAGLIPQMFYLNGGTLSTGDFVLLRILPVVCGSISGWIFGDKLIAKSQNSRAAILRGIGTAFFAYLIFAIGLVLFPTLMSMGNGKSPLTIWMFPFIIFMGVVYMGWLLAIIGGVVGWLLYMIFSPQNHRAL